MKKKNGFTLIELMVVVSIIGILASIGLPQYQTYTIKSEVVEALTMAGTVRQNVTAYYIDNLSFPEDNTEAGLPPSDKLIGNRITGVEVEGGVIHVTMGNKASQPLQGAVLSFRPATVVGSPASPIAWLCGFDEAVEGMEPVGMNRTSLERVFLPSACSD